MDTWRRMIQAQGGDPAAALPVAREQHVVTAPSSGVLTQQDALPFGVSAWRLGAGRARAQDPVQAGAGIELHVKPGDTVTEGQPLWTLHSDDESRIPRALESLEGAWAIGTSAEPRGPIVRERIAG
jgi:thymidine phosphorylase